MICRGNQCCHFTCLGNLHSFAAGYSQVICRFRCPYPISDWCGEIGDGPQKSNLNVVMVVIGTSATQCNHATARFARVVHATQSVRHTDTKVQHGKGWFTSYAVVTICSAGNDIFL